MGLGVTLVVSDLLLVYYFFIFPFIIALPLWLAIRFPVFRSGVGFVTFILSVVALFFEVATDAPVGLIATSGLFGAVFGFSLLVWGLTSRSSTGVTQTRQVARVCPKCGKNLSFFPDDIRLCPYCGNQVA